MSNSDGFDWDVNVVPFDVGHDIDDTGVDVDDGDDGVDEEDGLLCHLRLATKPLVEMVDFRISRSLGHSPA
jgi:hypothetical protein